MKILAIAIISLSVLAGCASDLNIRNANSHAQAGYLARKNGDWNTSMREFAKAVVNADLGNADPLTKVLLNYEYGRSLGVICKYDDAENYLLRSKSIKEQLGQSPYLALYELGLLNETQEKYKSAGNYFSKLIPEMKKEGLLNKYPLGVADAYDRYATALEKSGQANEALSQRIEANAIRAKNPAAKPFGALTPYGTQCAKH